MLTPTVKFAKPLIFAISFLSAEGTLLILNTGARFAWLESVNERSIGQNSGPMKTSRKSETSTISATTAILRLKKALIASFDGLSSFSIANISSFAISLLAPINIRLNQRPSVLPIEDRKFDFFAFDLSAISLSSFIY